jgi:hypothetical protein
MTKKAKALVFLAFFALDRFCFHLKICSPVGSRAVLFECATATNQLVYLPVSYIRSSQCRSEDVIVTCFKLSKIFLLFSRHILLQCPVVLKYRSQNFT